MARNSGSEQMDYCCFQRGIIRNLKKSKEMSQDNSSFRLVQHIKCVTLWNVQWMAINMRNRSGLQMNKARRSTERGGAYGEYAYIIRVFIKYR